MDREEHTVLAPQEGTWAGSTAPLFLYFTHSPRSTIPWESPSPFRPSRVGGRQGREGDGRGLSRSSRPWAPQGVSGHCSGAGRRGPAGSSASP